MGEHGGEFIGAGNDGAWIGAVWFGDNEILSAEEAEKLFEDGCADVV